jgi:hypothetical protein
MTDEGVAAHLFGSFGGGGGIGLDGGGFGCGRSLIGGLGWLPLPVMTPPV